VSRLRNSLRLLVNSMVSSTLRRSGAVSLTLSNPRSWATAYSQRQKNRDVVCEMAPRWFDLAGTQGFEPRYAAPEAAVLPLDDVPTFLYSSKCARA
jgi:hypothetical protein